MKIGVVFNNFFTSIYGRTLIHLLSEKTAIIFDELRLIIIHQQKVYLITMVKKNLKKRL